MRQTLNKLIPLLAKMIRIGALVFNYVPLIVEAYVGGDYFTLASYIVIATYRAWRIVSK